MMLCKPFLSGWFMIVLTTRVGLKKTDKWHRLMTSCHKYQRVKQGAGRLIAQKLWCPNAPGPRRSVACSIQTFGGHRVKKSTTKRMVKTYSKEWDVWCLPPINWWFGFRNHPQYHMLFGESQRTNWNPLDFWSEIGIPIAFDPLELLNVLG